MNNLENKIERKFIKSYNINDYEIETEDGWKDIIKIHKTIKYDTYELNLDSGLSLNCADNHIVFLKNKNQIFVKDLNPGDEIITINGVDKVSYIKKLNKKENMYDVTVDSKNHSYFTNRNIIT